MSLWWIVVAALLSLIIAVMHPYHRPSQTATKPIRLVLDARKLPAKCQVLGGTVTLEAIRQPKPGCSQAVIRIECPDRRKHIIPAETKVTAGGEELPLAGGELQPEATRDDHATLILWPVRSPLHTRKLTVVQSLYLESERTRPRFRFQELQINGPEITIRHANTSVTIGGLRIGRLTPQGTRTWRMLRSTSGQAKAGDNVLIVDLRTKLHECSTIRGSVKIDHSGRPLQIEGLTGTETGYVSLGMPRLTDSSGTTIPPVAVIHRATGGPTAAFHSATSNLTLTEKAVSKVSTGFASDLVTRRALAAATDAQGRQSFYYAYPLNKLSKEPFTLEVSLHVPPPNSDRAEVVFQNAPAPQLIPR